MVLAHSKLFIQLASLTHSYPFICFFYESAFYLTFNNILLEDIQHPGIISQTFLFSELQPLFVIKDLWELRKIKTQGGGNKLTLGINPAICLYAQHVGTNVYIKIEFFTTAHCNSLKSN